MKSFLAPYTGLFDAVLRHIQQNPYITLSYRIDKNTYFKNKLDTFLQQKSFFEIHTLDILPPVYRATYAIAFDNLRIHAFGSGYEEENVLLSTQAELLERLASWKPYHKEMFKKNTFLAKSLLGLRWKKKHSRELYWGLAEKTQGKSQVTTSGIAGHFDTYAALVGAWLELIERDAFLVYWLNTISPKSIDLTELISQDKEFETVLTSCKYEGISYHVMDITSDIKIPTCLVILTKKTDKGIRFGVGACSHFNGAQAIKKSFAEAATTLNASLHMEAMDMPADFKPFDDKRIDKNNRLRVPLTPEGFSQVEFLVSSEETISFESFSQQVDLKGVSTYKKQFLWLRGLFREKYKKNKAYDVHVYFFKHPLAEQFGFKVARVMCDGLYPLYLSEHFANPDHPRLREFVTAKGLESTAQLNTFPHPFS